MNAQELLIQIEKKSKAQITSSKILRNKPLTVMSSSELTDYAYAQVSDWPVRINQSEKQALMNAMFVAVHWAKESGMTSEQLSDKHRTSRVNREQRIAAEAELARPHLQEIEVAI